MGTNKFVLLDIDCITRKGRPVVRSFGKLPSGRSIIAHDRNFKPYIYVLPYHLSECMDELDSLGLPSQKTLRKKDGNLEKEFIKITLDHPCDVPHLREKIRNLKEVEDIREYDVPFEVRYLIDKGLYPWLR